MARSSAAGRGAGGHATRRPLCTRVSSKGGDTCSRAGWHRPDFQQLLTNLLEATPPETPSPPATAVYPEPYVPLREQPREPKLVPPRRSQPFRHVPWPGEEPTAPRSKPQPDEDDGEAKRPLTQEERMIRNGARYGWVKGGNAAGWPS